MPYLYCVGTFGDAPGFIRQVWTSHSSSPNEIKMRDIKHHIRTKNILLCSKRTKQESSLNGKAVEFAFSFILWLSKLLRAVIDSSLPRHWLVAGYFPAGTAFLFTRTGPGNAYSYSESLKLMWALPDNTFVHHHTNTDKRIFYYNQRLTASNI